MRVSNIVKDYIRSEIEKKYPIYNLPEYDDAMSRISEFEKNLQSKLDTIVNDAKSTFSASNLDIPKNVTDRYYINVYSRGRNIYRPEYSRYRAKSDWELENNNNDHLDEIYKKREDAFNSIVVALELGGTKADLERMLADL